MLNSPEQGSALSSNPSSLAEPDPARATSLPQLHATAPAAVDPTVTMSSGEAPAAVAPAVVTYTAAAALLCP